MKVIAISVLAWLSACDKAPPDNAANVADSANTAVAANPVPTDCPEEELSCGRQRPVVSDGHTPFADDNHYFAVTFPRGSEVCMTRSGNAPHGFFAVYGTPAGCPERPERPPRFISAYAEFNALFWTELSQASDGCAPLSAATRQRLGPVPPQLPGFPSAICEARPGTGVVELKVYALAGPWQTQGVPPHTSRYRAALYYFTLGTTDAAFDEDLARFRRVLASVRIATRE